MTLAAQTIHTLNLAAVAAESKGATDIVALDVADRFGLADAFVIATGEVERSVQAISDEIEHQLNEAGIKTVRREGRELGRWVLLDFGDIIVHVFHEEERSYYDLERLWRDCPVIELETGSQGLPFDEQVR